MLTFEVDVVGGDWPVGFRCAVEVDEAQVDGVEVLDRLVLQSRASAVQRGPHPIEAQSGTDFTATK